MKALKKLGSITLITLILLTGFIQLENKSYFVFADSSTDQWTTVTTNQELVEAFRYYCKSRNLAVDGSVIDAVTSFTTYSFNTICDGIGIDITALQAHLKRSTDSNGKVQFLFDEFGITAYNRIFAEFLQNNDLAVGDVANEQDNIVYSGQVFTDNLGRSCLVYISNGLDLYHDTTGKTLYKGTPYIYSSNDLVNLVNSSNYTLTLVCNNLTINRNLTYLNEWNISNSKKYYNCTRDISFDGTLDSSIIYSDSFLYNGNTYTSPILGNYAITFNTVDSKYYVTFYNEVKAGSNYVNNRKVSSTAIIISDNDVQSTNIFFTTNNNTINNNNYTDNSQTVINNDGDVYNYDYDDDDPPINPPSGGGDGDSPSDWGVELPDLDINWILAGKENKFPFDIPFNIMFALSLLNAEPEAPHFEGTINFGFTSYNYDIDFIQFDPVAVIFRRLMFLAFIFGLMFLTKQLIWG